MRTLRISLVDAVTTLLLLALAWTAVLSAQTAPPAAANTEPAFQTYRTFDFVAGEKIVGLEDCLQESVGDFHARWNTNAAGEIVKRQGRPGRWL